ncbi:SRPBCC family protein [Rhodanobacter sp. L36]|uniref:SRPBCC family protein n=1 Tax=Rhodanobacter sp. L36 TaxID=1747221 RepID=UPI00131E68C6|nr:SRPBCC family protein [Rhodanobacter sp. L36]
MFKTIAILVVIAIVAVLAVAATRPDAFRVERSITIKAPPERIFARIDDFHQWASWSPYEKMDPAMRRSFSGSTSGNGATYAWDGNSKAGAGRMEIVQSSSPSKIVIKLDFTRPIEGHNLAEFTLQPQGEMTTVTWSMHGPSPYVAKLMGIFFNMDHMIGKDFEVGLANLKAVSEK